jgi:hypothetical protein
MHIMLFSIALLPSAPAVVRKLRHSTLKFYNLQTRILLHIPDWKVGKKIFSFHCFLRVLLSTFLSTYCTRNHCIVYSTTILSVLHVNCNTRNVGYDTMSQ